MGTFAHIVVAVDGSDPAHRATAFAVELAGREGARVSFCSVIDPMPDDVLSTLEERARAVCSAATASAVAGRVIASSTVLHGTTATAIEQFAHERCADAIVVGAHGRKGFAPRMLGSVASSIVRHSRIPVFTVRAHATLDSYGPVLVAVDDSPPARAAQRAAIELARSQRAALHLVHVFGDGAHDADLRRRALQLAAGRFEDAADRVRAHPVPFSTELCEGEPVAELLAAANRHGARLIASGTHGRDAQGRLVLGSVTEGLLRDAPVPVMTVRA
ncbi:MAG: universal stress protein [Candidatus Eremiobacteraeota bacterium]|nr:universal stress protein [Candidatus Eremiobacteraeota bacterium]